MIVVNARFLTQDFLTGVQRFAMELCLSLSARNKDNDIIFVCPKNIYHKDTAEKLNAQVIGSLTGVLWEQIELPLYLYKNKSPLLLNLANTAPMAYGNQIITIHDVAYLFFPEVYKKAFVAYYKLMNSFIIKNSLRILTVSEFSKKEILAKYKIKDKVAVIHNAARCEEEEAGRDFVKQVPAKYFLTVGAFNRRKNLGAIIKAFNELRGGLPEYSLVVVGASFSKYFQSIGEISGKAENMFFFNGVSDAELSYLYKNAEAFIYASVYEGFGLPPLEAQSAGVPAIISDIEVFREIYGDSTLYFDPLSSKDLADKLRSFVKDGQLKEQLIAKGKENAKKYSWEKSFSALWRILEEAKRQ